MGVVLDGFVVAGRFVVGDAFPGVAEAFPGVVDAFFGAAEPFLGVADAFFGAAAKVFFVDVDVAAFEFFPDAGATRFDAAEASVDPDAACAVAIGAPPGREASELEERARLVPGTTPSADRTTSCFVLSRGRTTLRCARRSRRTVIPEVLPGDQGHGAGNRGRFTESPRGMSARTRLTRGPG